MTGHEAANISDSLAKGFLCDFLASTEILLEEITRSPKALLTHSCTNALEMAAVLCDISPGDEVIMPSYTFASTASAFALRGANIVFADITPRDMNICPSSIHDLISKRTKAIIPVHYAGAACDMESILNIAESNQLIVVEDAAQGIGALHCGKALGTFGSMGTLSFHITKNIHCQQGGALLINDEKLIDRAEIIYDKGTNRAQFKKGKIKQYEWVDLGISAPMTNIQAAHLHAQLKALETVTEKRLSIWKSYYDSLRPLEKTGKLKILTPLNFETHNAHIFGIIFESEKLSETVEKALKELSIETARHYKPLHMTPAGLKFGCAKTRLINSESLYSKLLRLPIWPDMPRSKVSQISNTIEKIIAS